MSTFMTLRRIPIRMCTMKLTNMRTSQRIRLASHIPILTYMNRSGTRTRTLRICITSIGTNVA
jgi:hypothetical protein